ncbi:nitroreductase/quinone reductase family protein [Xylanimonas ulmi]|uniref:Deazaflavin-dependent oxidoreductase (Nitroreductase family) n=1 Tax=Xylanimonas ulmi TaxID=228973 RepID=A0A4Q7M1Y6_9MICO|nr:nitroreductase/quinone reductase family protein [Xylanibacterium ulmi]RZS61444.1 deazaflavin-dependent oxidoreductase (nitroreductase family) [Xylanibacterium ulmi]
MSMDDQPEVVAPTRFAAGFNRVALGLTRHGVSLLGSRVLEVRGRVSGRPRETVVNLMRLDGATFLVAPRGVTQWVRNVRALPDGSVATRLGRRRQEWAATEVTDPAQAVPVLRHYLRRWAWEVGAFFPPGVSATSSDAELAALVGRKPVFRLTPR